ncbi:MAG: hypothetical protein IJ439_07405 [Tyzzerella sp.]|nr:hypothetical protein [Tyzzerella sp.]
MVVCVVVYLFLLIIWKRKGMRKVLMLLLFVSNSIAFALFAADLLGVAGENELTRNTYGGGSKTEAYEVTIDGEIEDEPLMIEIEEQQYTSAEIQEIFEEMMQKLDEVMLGENESRNRVDQDLNLVSHLEDYPVEIEWELDRYDVMDADGKILEKKTNEEGTLVEVRGILTYGSKEAVYVTNVMVYPRTKTEKEKWLDKVEESIEKVESSTREQIQFFLPETIDGKQVEWKKKADYRGYYILLLGIIGCVLLVWKEKQDKKEAEQKRREQMLRDYPDIISKFTLLLSTGMTVKNVWTKVVKGYEEQKEQTGKRAAYEEMCMTYREMQSGVPETVAYERFGSRCGVVTYMKFGALLSQNLRKGSRGLTDLLRMESMQAFENRKSIAKQKGEEASTKLLVPMVGMLAVVMVIVIIPAFLSIQL